MQKKFFHQDPWDYNNKAQIFFGFFFTRNQEIFPEMPRTCFQKELLLKGPYKIKK